MSEQKSRAEGKTQTRGPFGILFPFGKGGALMLLKSEHCSGSKCKNASPFTNEYESCTVALICAHGQNSVLSTKVHYISAMIVDLGILFSVNGHLSETTSQTNPPPILCPGNLPIYVLRTIYGIFPAQYGLKGRFPRLGKCQTGLRPDLTSFHERFNPS